MSSTLTVEGLPTAAITYWPCSATPCSARALERLAGSRLMAGCSASAAKANSPALATAGTSLMCVAGDRLALLASGGSAFARHGELKCLDPELAHARRRVEARHAAGRENCPSRHVEELGRGDGRLDAEELAHKVRPKSCTFGLERAHRDSVMARWRFRAPSMVFMGRCWLPHASARRVLPAETGPNGRYPTGCCHLSFDTTWRRPITGRCLCAIFWGRP